MTRTGQEPPPFYGSCGGVVVRMCYHFAGSICYGRYVRRHFYERFGTDMVIGRDAIFIEVMFCM